MRFSITKTICWLWVGWACALASAQEEEITRDVAIIGGGATGTFAAIKLRDLNHTVAVVEQKGRLGGHTDTYTDPETGIPVDYGVVFFHDLEIVHQFFDRFSVPLTSIPLSASSGGSTQYFDFTTGQRVNYTRAADPTAALQAYEAQLAKYPYLTEGFDLPDPVPEDLLLPFGEFAAKYGIDDTVFSIFQISQGYGDFLSIPAIYIMKIYSLTLVRDLLAGRSIYAAASGNNSEIYGLAQAELGADVHLHSTLLSASRNATSPPNYPIDLTISTPTGTKRIHAKQLLLTIPPIASNLSPLPLDPDELSLFAQFTYSHLWTGLLTNTGIPPNLSLSNVSPTRPFSLPPLPPGVYAFSTTRAPGVIDWKYAAEGPLSAEDVETEVLATLDRLRENSGVAFEEDAEPAFVAVEDHSPYAVRVGAGAIRGGFYERVRALQGRGGVWWTGAAWHTHDSGALWAFTEKIVENIVEGL